MIVTTYETKRLCVECGAIYEGRLVESYNGFICPKCECINVVKEVVFGGYHEGEETYTIFTKYSGVGVSVLYILSSEGDVELSFTLTWQMNFLGNRAKGVQNNNTFTLEYIIPKFNGKYKEALHELLEYAMAKVKSVEALKWPKDKLPVDGVGRFSYLEKELHDEN